jgi:hypothetical protein
MWRKRRIQKQTKMVVSHLIFSFLQHKILSGDHEPVAEKVGQVEVVVARIERKVCNEAEAEIVWHRRAAVAENARD